VGRLIASRPVAAASTDVPAGHGDLTRLARGGALNLVGGIVNGAFGFLLVVVLTRGLHGGAAGAFFEAIAIFSIAGATAAFGADVGLVRTIARMRARSGTADVRGTLMVALVPIGIAGALAGACVFGLAEPLARVFGRGVDQAVTAQYLRVLAPFIPVLALYTASVAATRGFGTMVPSVAVDRLGTPVVQPLLVVAVIASGAGAVALGLAYALPLAVGLVAALLWTRALLRRATPGGPRTDGTQAAAAAPWGSLFAGFWRFTAPRGLAGVFQVVVFWLNTLLVGAFVSLRAAAIYTAATRYILVGSLALLAVINVVGPQISDLLARDAPARARDVYQTATCWLMLLTWPLYLSLALFAPLLLRVFGPGFDTGATALAILCVAMLVSMATGPVDTVLLMAGKSGWNLANTAVALGLNVGLNLVLIPRLGIRGAAIAWAASVVANNVLPLLEVWLLMGLEPFGRGFPLAALLGGLCYGGLGLATRLALGATLGSFVLFGVVATATYAGLCWWLREPLELTALARAFGSRRRRHPAG
jgi:O-antigen/teichoic acid export membrane protein